MWAVIRKQKRSRGPWHLLESVGPASRGVPCVGDTVEELVAHIVRYPYRADTTFAVVALQPDPDATHQVLQAVKIVESELRGRGRR
jgi:hypothetical protein